ncbi:MAG: efflux RND transporter periplasmic adaptor subunit, partial [Wenzhouxiangellaceae bacterium]
MNRITLPIFILVALLAGFALAWWLKPTAEAPEQAGGEREILYWVAPMDPNFRRDEPGKSPMGMDLVPVYADDAGDAGAEPSIRISPAVINNIGVRTEPVRRGRLVRRIDTVGFIAADDARIGHVHVRAEGWIEHLATVTEGDPVEDGALLFRMFSPALLSAQDEYLQAHRAGHANLIRASALRLDALGMSAGQIEELRQRGRVERLFEVRSPQSGFVHELNVRDGMFVQPGMTVMSLADLTTVWVDVDVFESRIGWLEVGQRASMRLPFAPERVWNGEVDYIYPTIREATRTARVRLKFDNPDDALKPGMYASVMIEAEPREQAVHVPTQAVIRTHDGDRVILALGEGRFRPAEVHVGMESGGRTEILAGLAEGESIVTNSQFLIDSEASADASLKRLVDPS